MKNLAKLLSLLQLTRHQTLYGYIPNGIKRQELPTLAEHSYLTALTAWRLVKNLAKTGAKINLARVLELAFVHDLGELFGGDISMPYARLNPKAKKLARDFEKENIKFLARFMGNDESEFIALAEELFEIKSDEAIIAKIADYMECAHFMASVDRLSKKTLDRIKNRAASVAGKAKNKNIQNSIDKEIESWAKDILKISRSKETDKYIE
jgi:5'-deoxynucleotidase YfbR-like HD superfamily hydrolase